MKKNGFTLLEMIVVIMIISVLFVLTIPNVSKVIKAVDTKACKIQTKVIDTAIVEYKLEWGVEPHDIKDLFIAGFITEEQMRCPNGAELRIEDGHTVYE